MHRKRISYKHPIKPAAQLSEHDQVVLVARLRAGDKTVASKLVEANVGLAMGICGYYGRYKSIDDIVSVALLALTEAVGRAATALTDNNLGPYLTANISRAINKFVKEDKLIPIPSETKRRTGQQDIKVNSIHNKIDTKEEFIKDLHFDSALVAKSNKGVEKIWERLFEIAITDLEREIILLKSQGYNNNEVASLTGKFPSEISKIKSELERRYYEQ